jgi:plastocyanin
MLGHMGTYQYRFMDPGANEYHCDPHPYMTGTVAVTA